MAPGGALEVVDPGFDSVGLLREIDPGFEVREAPLPGFSFPRFLPLRQARAGIARAALSVVGEDDLWRMHRAGAQPGGAESATVLELKTELARRVIGRCRLCAHRCEVDRLSGQTGLCGLGPEATVAEHYVHIAEEPPINPSLVLNICGCGLHCRHCQQGALLEPHLPDASPLVARLWRELETASCCARSVSFCGGNPDESLCAVLRFLLDAPASWPLPIIWNSHAYSTPETLELLEGVVDAYVPDLKYSNPACAEQGCGAHDYPEAARQSIRAMLGQGVPVLVRILVLPDHFACCHAPIVDFLAEVNCEHLWVSVRGQYCPDWLITSTDGAMARRVRPEEVQTVRTRAIGLGLRLVE